MISVAEAITAIVDRLSPLEPEESDLPASLGRYLATPISSPIDLPPFTCSAVDGYAVRSQDAVSPGTRLKLLESIPAGQAPVCQVGAGEAARLFTGSIVPHGADAVVMQEDVDAGADSILVRCAATHGSNLRRQGEELRSGASLFGVGTLINPSVLAAIANVGISRVRTFRTPRVGVLSTGSELAPLGQVLRSGQVYASNAVAVAAALTAMGAQVGDVRVVDDAPGSVLNALQAMLPIHDCVVTCGGVSVGDHDLVRGEAKAAGVEEIFWKVSIKPGKPFFFGLASDRIPVFGLPGNPVSALVCLYLLVRPGLAKMMGASAGNEKLRAVLDSDLTKQPGRTEYVRGILHTQGDRLIAKAVDRQGSHMGTGLASADCLIEAEADRKSYEKGEVINVIPLRWSLI